MRKNWRVACLPPLPNGTSVRPATACPKGLERIKDDIGLPHAPVEESLTGQRDQDNLARFYVDRGRRMFEQENDRGALAELSRALFLSPYQAEAHLLVGRIHLRGGRVQEAIDSLKISVWSAESAAAHAALAAAYFEAKDADRGPRRSDARTGARSRIRRGQAGPRSHRTRPSLTG